MDADLTGHSQQSALPEVAYYHEPYWGPARADWMKTLLLFFDGVAVLVPDYMRERPLFSDPELAQPLADQGLLHRLSPESLVDQQTTEALTALMVELLTAGAFDDLDKDEDFRELSRSRLGGMADSGLSDMVVAELEERGLARRTRDGVSVPLHPVVRAVVLVTLAQLLRAPGERAGYALQPVSVQVSTWRALLAALGTAPLPTVGHVVASDVEQVTFDLAPVPLADVLDFREEHGAQHRAYARQLRAFLRSLAPLDEREREGAFADRREELADLADELRRLARRRWRRPLTGFGLGIGGAAAAATAGNPVGAGFGAANALLGLKRQADPATAYSYLFSAQESFSRRW